MSMDSKRKKIITERFETITKTDSHDDELDLAKLTKPRQKETRRMREAAFVPIHLIVRDENQPREHFNQEELENLSKSIKRYGVKTPISATWNPEIEKYVIIAGERRYRASQMAGLSEMPCIVRKNISDVDRIAEQLIENIQREDLSPVEKAKGIINYRAVIEQEEKRKVKWTEIEERLDLTPRRRQQFLKLLELPDAIQKELVTVGSKRTKEQTAFTEVHARALHALHDNPDKQLQLWRQMKSYRDGPLSARAAMDMARALLGEPQEPAGKKLLIHYATDEDLLVKLQSLINDVKRRLKK